MTVIQSSVRYKYSKRHYPGYCVGDDGSVWSRRKFREWTRLRSKPNSDGYLRVSVHNGKQRVSKFVHILVLEAFVGECPLGQQCRHLNGDPSDNRLANIRWGTSKQQAQDKRRHGTMARLAGEKNGFSKLTATEVVRMRAMYESGRYTQETLARLFEVSQTSVSRVVLRRCWSHI